jgi:putative membrane protein
MRRHRSIGRTIARMLWVKAFHIVFVSSWFAALFYLPRIFVNLAQVATASHAERDRLLGMARRLHRFGMVLMTVALVLGLWLWLGYGIGDGQGWMHAKLALVLGVLAYQHVCLVILRRFERQQPTLSERGLRAFNEVSVLLFAAIVVLAVVKPW